METMVRKPKALTDAQLEQLMIYRALDSPTRLLAFEIIYDEPDVSFNGLARRLGVKTGLAAYHLAILKAAGLVEFRYLRRSKETSIYRLTKYGERWYRRLFGKRRLSEVRPAKPKKQTRSKTRG